MLSKRLMIGVLLLLIMAVPLSGVAAKGGSFTQVVISGDSIDNPIVITDDLILDSFSIYNFADLSEPLSEVPMVGDGYTITRGYWVSNSSFLAFDEVTYYPANDGALGYIYYDGLTSGWSEYNRAWYRMTAEGERAMRRIIGNYRVEHAPSWMQDLMSEMVVLNTSGIGHGQALDYWWHQ
jgi:hypothetical protein